MSYLGREPRGGGEFKGVDSISGFVNNTRVTFPLTVTSELGSYTLDAISPFSLLVVVDGAPLQPVTEFTVADGNITFNDLNTPTTVQSISIRALAEPVIIGVPTDNAINDGQFANGSVNYSNFTTQAQSNIIANIITFGL